MVTSETAVVSESVDVLVDTPYDGLDSILTAFLVGAFNGSEYSYCSGITSLFTP